MPNPNDDVLYMLRFKTAGGDAPGEHLAAVRSSPNRVTCSQHIKQLVDAHNTNSPDDEMTVISLTRCTQEELDAEVAKLRESDATRVDVSEVYAEEKDYNRVIATKKN